MKMIKLVLLLMVCFEVGWQISGCTMVASASDYVFREGYFWKDGVPYQRYRTRYCSRGCYYYRYSYRRVPVVSSKTPDWRAKLLDIASQRDRFELNNKKSALEHNEFLEAVNALGLSGNFRVNGYGAPVQYAQGLAASGIQQPFAEQGTSVYGYSYSTLADVYGSTDLNVLYNQAGNLAKDSLALGDRAVTGHRALVQEEGHNRARVAEILAKAQLLKAADTPSAHLKQEFNFRGTVDPETGKVDLEEADMRPRYDAQASAVFKAKCNRCHNANSKAGKSTIFPDGVDMTKFYAFSPKQQNHVLQVLRSGKMPKSVDNAPAEPLSLSELSSIIKSLE
jgi:cytochrome c553